MKGSLYANPTFVSKNIRQPTVISTRPLVAYDEHRLYFNGLSIKWEAKDIVNCTYSFNYKVLLVLSDNGKIYVFTEELELITHLSNWQSKYILGFKLIEQLNQMLLIGSTEIEVMKVKIVTNIKKTKFLSSMKFNIKKEIHLGVEPQHKLKWNKGYGYIVQEDLLYVWSLQDIYFYSLQKLTIRNKASNITKKQLSITTAYFSNYYKYTLGGLQNGQIKVWRISINPLSIQKQILIHSFACHCKEVDQIVEGQNQKCLISLGLDLYVCFMSIETFELLRIFNFVGEYTKIYLFDHFMAYAIKDNFLGELNYGKNIEFLSQLTGTPISFNRPQNQPSISSKVQLTLNSNLGIELDLEEVKNAQDTNKVELVHIYPPLKSKNIIQVISSPFETDNFYMLVEDGDIFRVSLQNRKGKIVGHYIISKIYDSQNHQLHQNGSYITFLHLLPPQIDTEMIDRIVDQKYDHSEQTFYERKLLAIGCSKGSIVFVSTKDMENIFARITYHRQKIVNFQEISNKETGKTWLASVCQERHLKLIIFEGGRASCISTILFGDASIRVVGFGECLALVLQKGIFEVARFIEHHVEPLVIVNRDCINHEDEIVALSYRQDLKLILTGGKDNRIKIWTTYKILMYEIIIDKMLKFSTWGTGMSVILIQDLKLCCLRGIPLRLDLTEVETANKEFELNYLFEDEFTLSKFVEQYLYKLKAKKFKIRPLKQVTIVDSPITDKKQQSKHFSITLNKRQSKSLNKSGVISDRTALTSKRNIFKTEQSQPSSDRVRQESDREATRKHLQQMSSLKKDANRYNFPKITTKNQDIFVDFLRERIMNKRLLTRRDITLNRIILKNLVKDHIKVENEFIQSVRIE